MTKHDQTGFWDVTRVSKKLVSICIAVGAVGTVVFMALPYLNEPSRQDATDATLAEIKSNTTNYAKRRMEQDVKNVVFQQAITGNIEGISAKMDTLDAKVTSLDAKVCDMQTDVGNLTAKVNTLSSTVNDYDGRLKRLDTFVSQLLKLKQAVNSAKGPEDFLADNELAPDQVPFLLNYIDGNTREANIARRRAQGLPPEPSKDSMVKKDLPAILEEAAKLQNSLTAP